VPRFVVLEHDWPVVHWDLLLECGPVLKAWRLLAEPGPGRAVPAEPNFDHRLLYLDYEGPLSGDRGRVRRWDAGTYDGELGDEWEVRFAGRRLVVLARMTRTADGWEFQLV
jgi:DNA polymerase ligase (LigD)-like protein